MAIDRSNYEEINFSGMMFIDFDATLGNPAIDVNKTVDYLLLKMDASEIKLFDTGNNGYHISFPSTAVQDYKSAHELASHMKENLGLDSLDLGFYTMGRLVLKEGCLNPKTGQPKLKLCNIEKYAKECEQDQETIKMELEEKLLRFFQNKEIAKERNDENKLLSEEIEALIEKIGEEGDIVLQLPNGEYAIVSKKATVKDVLDKDALAQKLLIAKDELKTPFDWSILTKQGKVTPDLIKKHTETVTEVKTKITKRKSKTRVKKV
jgi:hypothetical protein